MRRPGRVAVFLLAAASGLVVTCPAVPVDAAETGEFSLRPVRPASAPARERSYIVRTVQPGDELADRLEAVNLTDAPIELAVRAVDATILEDGSFAPGTTADGDGRWFEVSPTTIRVPARGTAGVDVRIRVPADASAGDHIAAVVAQRADGRPTPGQGNVQLVQRVGVRAYLTVQGGSGAQALRRAFEFRSVRWVGAPKARAFEAEIANVGGLLVEPLGSLTIDRGGLSADHELPVLGSVPAGQSRVLRLSAEGDLEPGTYDATVRLRDVNGGPEHERTISFTVGAETGSDAAKASSTEDAEDKDGRSRFPWWLVLLALVLLVAVAARILRERQNSS